MPCAVRTGSLDAKHPNPNFATAVAHPEATLHRSVTQACLPPAS